LANAVFLEVMVLLALLGHPEERGQLVTAENLAHPVTMVVQAHPDCKV
jgi:hypothetical protein